VSSRRFDRLFAAVDGASLGAFRFAFGAIMLWEVVRYFQHGWIRDYYVDPGFHFTYAGFRWVRPWPADLMAGHFAGLGACAVAIALGFRARLAAGLFFLGFSYVFLLEKARYLNHFYLVILLAGLFAVLPPLRAYAVDWTESRRQRQRHKDVPAWALGMMRTQIGLVYFFAGLAKLNEDWLRARPLTTWLADRADHPMLGPLLEQSWTPWLFSYGGLALDLAAWPLLAWRRTRVSAFLLVCAFHLTNATLFNIGIFPWLMIAASTLFFEPDWPRQLGRWFSRTSAPPPISPPPAQPPAQPSARHRRVVLAFLALYFGFQFLFPLRHFLYPGSVHWNEEGHAFAWHMKLRGKHGEARFRITDPASDEQWLVDPGSELEDWQARKLSGRPDMILEYAHHLARRMEARGHPDVEVRALVHVSLNHRPMQQLIDPEVDLAIERWGAAPSNWILPLQPLGVRAETTAP
jgi:vitamin K-dependent gamma-carboxylase